MQCNRQYPCNHCTRRRRPEDCVYYPSDAPLARSGIRHENNEQNTSRRRKDGANSVPCDVLPDLKDINSPTNNASLLALAEVFGYSEDSHTNTWALLQKASRCLIDRYAIPKPCVLTCIFTRESHSKRASMGEAELYHLTRQRKSIKGLPKCRTAQSWTF